MLYTPDVPAQTFMLLHSEDDRAELQAFIQENGPAINRLLKALTDKPGYIDNDQYRFAEPVYLKVDAHGLKVLKKRPNQGSRARGSCLVVFSIASRSTAATAVEALGLATVLGCMRIRDAVRACNRVYASGADAQEILEDLAGTFARQIESAAYHLLAYPIR